MKFNIFPFMIFFLLLMNSSCIKQTAEYQALKEQNDSLIRAKHQMQAELDEFMSAMNLIEQNIEKIKSAENIVTLQSAGEELDDDTRNKINQDLMYLNEMLKANREELAKLKKNLRNSAIKTTELERSLARLSKALEEESQKVKILYEQLAQKDSLIAQLESTVEELGSDIEELKTENEKKQEVIKEQDETINTAWYVFGTRKELREQNIITSDGLFRPQRVLESDFNKNYFVKIDARKIKSIPLYSTRAKILTNHPRSSYTLEKENNNFVLIIVDYHEFWSISKYLVVEVD
jgi:chromosome segregation ATPase